MGMATEETLRTLASSPDTWEYTTIPADGIDLLVDPEGGTKTPSGPAKWFEVLAAGDITVITSKDRTVTYTGLEAGRAYGVQIKKIVSAAGGVRVGW